MTNTQDTKRVLTAAEIARVAGGATTVNRVKARKGWKGGGGRILTLE